MNDLLYINNSLHLLNELTIYLQVIKINYKECLKILNKNKFTFL